MGKTVVNPLQAALVNGAVITPGYDLTKRYSEKMNKHSEGCRRAGILFFSLPMDTLGGWQEQTVCQVKIMGRLGAMWGSA